MNPLNRLRSLAAATFLTIGVISSPAGDLVPTKARVTGQTLQRVYLADPTQVPLGTPFLYAPASGVGVSSQLGKFSITFNTLVHAELIDNKLSYVWQGTFVATAANGDQVFGTFRNYRYADSFDFVGESEWTGGTGRFEGVSGLVTIAGVLTPQPAGLDLFEYDLEGLVSSVGANKKK